MLNKVEVIPPRAPELGRWAERRTMEEVYTCECGNQTWKIFCNRVQCSKCLREYGTLADTQARAFNKERKQLICAPPAQPDVAADDKRRCTYDGECSWRFQSGNCSNDRCVTDYRG